MGFRSSSVSGGGITGFFGDRAFARSLMHIALPVTLQSMLRASFSIIDQVMIGQLAAPAFRASGWAASLHLFIMWCSAPSQRRAPSSFPNIWGRQP